MAGKKKDKVALELIKQARILTTWGFVDDYLSQAQDELQRMLDNDC